MEVEGTPKPLKTNFSSTKKSYKFLRSLDFHLFSSGACACKEETKIFSHFHLFSLRFAVDANKNIGSHVFGRESERNLSLGIDWAINFVLKGF